MAVANHTGVFFHVVLADVVCLDSAWFAHGMIFREAVTLIDFGEELEPVIRNAVDQCGRTCRRRTVDLDRGRSCSNGPCDCCCTHVSDCLLP